MNHYYKIINNFVFDILIKKKKEIPYTALFSEIDPPPLICCVQESTSFSLLCTWDKQTLNMTQWLNHVQEKWQWMFYTITQLFDILFITLLTHLSQTCYRSRLKHRWMQNNHREGFNENELQLVYVQLCT